MPKSIELQFKAARRAGTPIIAIKTLDAEALIQSLQKSLNGDAVVVQHDIVLGLRGRSKPGQEAITVALRGDPIEATVDEVEALKAAKYLPEDSVLFLLNAHRYMERAASTQAIANLRATFEEDGCTAVLLGPDFQLPAELQQDVLILDEPLPDDEDLGRVVTTCVKEYETSVKCKLKADGDTLARATDALRGLSPFSAKQSVALSLSKTGIDLDGLWERKRQLISSTRALSVYKGDDSFDRIGGCSQVKKFMHGVIAGKEAPRCIVFIDEGEKMFAGAAADWVGDSGVAKDSLATTLQFMEDHEADGAIFVGPPGAAKSAVAKATGNAAGIPTIILDLGAARAGEVGAAEANIRQAYKVVDAVGGGRAYFIMTCNKIAVLPPELKRRFTSGIFYFELPDAYTVYRERTERNQIWDIWLKRYGLTLPSTGLAFNDDGWTGAEIRNCCRLAYRLDLSLDDASKFIVPVCISAADQIAALRREASGKYLCANMPGVYEFKEDGGAVAISSGRRKMSE